MFNRPTSGGHIKHRLFSFHISQDLLLSKEAAKTAQYAAKAATAAA